MAAVADLTEYRSLLAAPREIAGVAKIATTMPVGRMVDWWQVNTINGSDPTTAVVPDNTTTGAIQQADAGSEELRVMGAQLSARYPGVWILCDRLSHQGGLSGTVTTANLTTNLPTAALTRYTTGDGVLAAVKVGSTIGATPTTISCTYTNQAGSNSTSPLMGIGGTGHRESHRFLILPLAAGDTGVRAIVDSTLTGTTGTAGAFGYVLFKPLIAFCFASPGGAELNLIDGGIYGGLPVIEDGACLFWISLSNDTPPALDGTLPFVTV